jgi:hypothetical protein
MRVRHLKYGFYRYDNSNYEYVLSSTISNGLAKYLEEIIYVYWNEFRMNRGQIDNIHILTEKIEKTYEYKIQNKYTFYRF